jgi:hypothetical protein
VLATFAVGLLAAGLAIGAADRNDYSGAGTCLIAAALSFGLLLQALMRR